MEEIKIKKECVFNILKLLVSEKLLHSVKILNKQLLSYKKSVILKIMDQEITTKK